MSIFRVFLLRRGLGRELRRGVETASTGRTRKVVGADTYKERWHDFAKCAFGVHGVQTKAGTSRQVLSAAELDATRRRGAGSGAQPELRRCWLAGLPCDHRAAESSVSGP